MNRFEEIALNLAKVRDRIATSANSVGRGADEITLIAVTKNFPINDIDILHKLGVTNFGENRDQEASRKAGAVEGTWHFQGQIQSNKLKSICSWADVIHSLDDLKHFALIEKSALHPLQIFLQVNLDGALGRGGEAIEALLPLAQAVQESSLHSLVGLMAVAPLEVDAAVAFSRLSIIHKEFLQQFPEATSLSAGMSGDFEAAISSGATHVRIGSSILGSRK